MKNYLTLAAPTCCCVIVCPDGKWIFLMNDIIVYEGKHLKSVLLPDRLKILYNILENQYTPDKIIDVCEFKVKTFYYPFKESIDAMIKLSKELNYTSRGIYLWSYDLKYKPKLHNFNEDNIISVVRKVKDETEFQIKNKSSSDNEIDENIISNIIINNDDNNKNEEKLLWMTQTDYPDVYNLYDNENILISKKIGIALIPNLITSKMIRLSFKNKNSVTLIKVKCLYNIRFNKWYPIEVIK